MTNIKIYVKLSRKINFLTSTTISNNDTAERGIKLFINYSTIITKDEDQKQFLLRVISDYRKQFPDAKRGTLLKPLQL
ncbi:hypothetical protein ALC60_05009 [Trachymyrmex zeteki]|uniref:Uncharacterized protein n=1 Tax=Mycetomoellerius zeteki TaxID=64791 RepID=A0A151X6L1_9HYME|nr:hypothetical protein ALC60_05009 [Trachymyrmex zeteki]